MKRHWYMIYFGLIIGGLFTLGITMFIRPAKHFSENENRVLQQIPDVYKRQVNAQAAKDSWLSPEQPNEDKLCYAAVSYTHLY